VGGKKHFSAVSALAGSSFVRYEGLKRLVMTVEPENFKSIQILSR